MFLSFKKITLQNNITLQQSNQKVHTSSLKTRCMCARKFAVVSIFFKNLPATVCIFPNTGNDGVPTKTNIFLEVVNIISWRGHHPKYPNKHKNIP